MVVYCPYEHSVKFLSQRLKFAAPNELAQHRSDYSSSFENFHPQCFRAQRGSPNIADDAESRVSVSRQLLALRRAVGYNRTHLVMAARLGRSAAAPSNNWRRRSGSFWSSGGEQQGTTDSESVRSTSFEPHGGPAPCAVDQSSGAGPEHRTQWRRQRPKSQMLSVGGHPGAPLPTCATGFGCHEACAHVPFASTPFSVFSAGESEQSGNWRTRGAPKSAQSGPGAAWRSGCGGSRAHMQNSVVEYTRVHVQSTCEHVLRKCSCETPSFDDASAASRSGSLVQSAARTEREGCGSPSGADASCCSYQFYDDDDILVASASYAPPGRQQQSAQPPPPHKSTRPYFERQRGCSQSGNRSIPHTFQPYPECSSTSSGAPATDRPDDCAPPSARHTSGVSERIARALKSCRDQCERIASSTSERHIGSQQPPVARAGNKVPLSVLSSKQSSAASHSEPPAAPTRQPPPERRGAQRAPRHVRQIRMGAGEDWLPAARIESLLAPSTVAELVIGGSDEERERHMAKPDVSDPESVLCTALTTGDCSQQLERYNTYKSGTAAARFKDESFDDYFFSDPVCPPLQTATASRAERHKHSSEPLFEELLNGFASGIGAKTFQRFDAIDNQLHDIMSTSLTRVSQFDMHTT